MAPDEGVFSIATDDDGTRLHVAVRGELDLATAPELESVVFPALDAGGRVMLDLRELAFMDSSGVRVMVAAHARVEGDGARFAVVRPPPDGEVARIIEISGVGTKLRMIDDPAAF